VRERRLLPFFLPLFFLFPVSRAGALPEGIPCPGPEPPGLVAEALPAERKPLFQGWKKGPNLLVEKGWFVWGGSVIRGEDGRWHMFYSRWPKALGFTAWLVHSEIAHAVAERPEGPYSYVETVLEGRGPGHWDAVTAHNPKIKKFGNKYYLYYISTRGVSGRKALEGVARRGYGHPKWRLLRNNQRTGVAVSAGLNGPWKRLDAPIVEPSGPIARLAVNPAVCRGPGGKFYMIVKGDKPGAKRFLRNEALALSDTPLGPFRVQPRPVIDSFDTEDASMWYDRTEKRFYAVYHTRGRIGLVASTDGIRWGPAFHDTVCPKEVFFRDGTRWLPQRMERPFVLADEEGRARLLFVAVKKGNRSGNVCLPLGRRPTYRADWKSLDRHPTPRWFREAKLGIFVTWGLYSVPAYSKRGAYAEWYARWVKAGAHGGLERRFHEKRYGKDFRYRDFTTLWKAELWDPGRWARLFRRAGARYVVLVSKFHDGFALWPSREASKVRGYPWNSVETGPKRDIAGELARAVRRAGLRFGTYFSLMEWGNPLYDKDPGRYVEEQMIPQIRDLVRHCRPAILWADGEWVQPDTVWRSTGILAELYNKVPNYLDFLVNDRWGKGLRGLCGDVSTTEYGKITGGRKRLRARARPFEEVRGMGRSFGWNRLEPLEDYLEGDALVRLFVDTVSRGGNLLLNVGPRADGMIPLLQKERLLALGKWLGKNGEAVYGAKKGPLGPFPWGRTTVRGRTLFLFVFHRPDSGILELKGLHARVKEARFLDGDGRVSLKFEGNGGGGNLRIRLEGRLCPGVKVIALECEKEPASPGEGR